MKNAHYLNEFSISFIHSLTHYLSFSSIKNCANFMIVMVLRKQAQREYKQSLQIVRQIHLNVCAFGAFCCQIFFFYWFASLQILL